MQRAGIGCQRVSALSVHTACMTRAGGLPCLAMDCSGTHALVHTHRAGQSAEGMAARRLARSKPVPIRLTAPLQKARRPASTPVGPAGLPVISTYHWRLQPATIPNPAVAVRCPFERIALGLCHVFRRTNNHSSVLKGTATE